MKTAGLILAGGKSRRMDGHHKGNLLTAEGLTFMEHTVREMRYLTDCIYISYGDTVRAEIPGCRIVQDVFKECGPVGGLHAGLRAAAEDGADLVMTAACDMPYMRSDLYRCLYDRLTVSENKAGDNGALSIAVPENGNDSGAVPAHHRLSDPRNNLEYDGAIAAIGEWIHPLAAIYRVDAANIFEQQLLAGNRKLRDAVKKLRILYVDLKGTEFEKMLVNINTQDDYTKMMHGLGSCLDNNA